jgi:hypothetical protein
MYLATIPYMHAETKLQVVFESFPRSNPIAGTRACKYRCCSRKVNDGKFGKIPDESTWKLSKKAAMVYMCENEVGDI